MWSCTDARSRRPRPRRRDPVQLCRVSRPLAGSGRAPRGSPWRRTSVARARGRPSPFRDRTRPGDLRSFPCRGPGRSPPPGPRRRRRARPAPRSAVPPVEHLEDGAVSQADERGGVGRFQETRHFVDGSGCGNERGSFGCTTAAAGSRHARLHGAGTDGTTARTRACARRSRAVRAFVLAPGRRRDRRHERPDGRLVDVTGDEDIALRAERHVASQVSSIRGERVRRQPPLHGQVVEVAFGPHRERVGHRPPASR